MDRICGRKSFFNRDDDDDGYCYCCFCCYYYFKLMVKLILEIVFICNYLKVFFLC